MKYMVQRATIFNTEITHTGPFRQSGGDTPPTLIDTVTARAVRLRDQEGRPLAWKMRSPRRGEARPLGSEDGREENVRWNSNKEGNMKTWSLIAAVLFSTFFVTGVFAAPTDTGPTPPGQAPVGQYATPKAPPGPMHGWRGPGFGARQRMVSYLGLTPEQINKMRELRGRYRNETHDLRYDLAIKRTEMRKLFTDPKVNEATLMAKQKEISSLTQQLMDKRAQMKIEWRKILTAEQIQKLDSILPVTGHHGMGGGMGDGMRHGMMAPHMGYGGMGPGRSE